MMAVKDNKIYIDHLSLSLILVLKFTKLNCQGDTHKILYNCKDSTCRCTDYRACKVLAAMQIHCSCKHSWKWHNLCVCCHHLPNKLRPYSETETDQVLHL